VRDPATATDDNPMADSPGTVVLVDNAAGILELKRAMTRAAPHPTSLVPYTIVNTPEQRASLLRVGEWVADHGIDPDGIDTPGYRAARDLLLRRRPPSASPPAPARLAAPASAPRTSTPETPPGASPALADSYLAIQAARLGQDDRRGEMSVDLVDAGRKVGVTANSHKVIGLLLSKVAKAAVKRGVAVRLGQKPATNEDPTCTDARAFKDNASLRDALADDEIDVAGGTGWVWSREEFAGSVDVLFVDEAGQLSLANAVAVSPAARSLVLLGDPQQLDQPLQGSHPPGAERSALAHLLEGGPRPPEPRRTTMPGELGLFLDGTWRLHPDICAYTSEVFYESRLEPEPGRERQSVGGAGVLDGAGIRFVPVHHEGNRNESDEEAEALAGLVAELVGRRPSPRWTDDKGNARPLGLDDVLVITPYNAQVRSIAETIEGVRVGTVDKFQGQEAPISVYSMATSSAAEAPRGMEFLYSLNRLNVATSRALCVAAVIVPELPGPWRTPRQMQLANGWRGSWDRRRRRWRYERARHEPTSRWALPGGCRAYARVPEEVVTGDYSRPVFGETDRQIRLAVFDWLTDQRAEHGEALARTLLEGFRLGDRRIPLIGPSGIWKPAACELPISIATVVSGPYADRFDRDRGTLRYAYRGTDPQHRDNRGLRRAMRERVPFIYFHAVERGRYAAAYPVFVVADDRARSSFGAGRRPGRGIERRGQREQPCNGRGRGGPPTGLCHRDVPPSTPPGRVPRAGHPRLPGALRALPAAPPRAARRRPHHARPRARGRADREQRAALCKLHHAAFDGFFFAVRPDYVIEVRPSVLAETDGPMLVVGLQQIHGQRIHLPSRRIDLPDPDRLARRYEEFRQAS
jgi:uncharacterized protein